MALIAGTLLGPYEIISLAGTGGMGEVYRARDTRLERTVAIKVLPPHLSTQPERRERFEREARAVSALNHAHICTLYDIGNQNGIDFLVMEFLEGESLAERLTKGRLPLNQALQYATEIADALDKAQRHGITHRDLKPGNIMITKDGAKLLDFGLAKLRGADLVPMPVSASALPTDPQQLTAQGSILGTLQYMAPEQLEGNDADARTDIFALGAVLYEMITGNKAFQGKTQVSLMAAILEHDPPPLSAIIPMTPAPLDRLVRRCLAKDPDDRWQTARDLEAELQWVAESGRETQVTQPAAPAKRKIDFVAWSVAALAAVAAVVLAVLYFHPKPVGTTDMRFTLQPKKVFADVGATEVALSKDGRYLAFLDDDGTGKKALWLRALDSTDARLLPGTEGADNPFWSPDSKFVGFWVEGRLKKISTDGASPQTLMDGAPQNAAGTWWPNGVIAFGGYSSGLYRVSAAGGTPQVLTTLNRSKNEQSHQVPQLLPDGRHFLYFVFSNSPEIAGMYVRSLDSPDAKRVLSVQANGWYVDPGYLLVVQEEKLLAYPFDTRRLELTGEPIGIADNVGTVPNRPLTTVSVSANSMLAYGGSGAASGVQLVCPIEQVEGWDVSDPIASVKCGGHRTKSE
jgi:eukaryotic-like serine/threonine-protein kinase